jgi:hypothetical protein
MNLLKLKNRTVLSLLFILLATAGFAQKMTFVKGLVIDSDTKETLPLVNISFVGTAIGTTSEIDGTYVLESKWATDSIQISYVGYETQKIAIQKGVRQEVNVALSPVSLKIATVEVKAKRGRYKRKGNPAVELMKNVIDHKNDNKIGAKDFYEFDKYEKTQFDINNFDPEKLRGKRAFKKFQFLLDYVDTSELNGKPFLPFFIQEISSKVYYRKNPEGKKEFREGVKVTGMREYVDLEDMTTMMDMLYQDIDIFKDDVRLLDLTFISPLASLANPFYRFYITDTTAVVNNYPCVKVSFMPVNNQNVAFRGDLYIIRDSSYALVKADLGITRQINVNFVQDIKLLQEFEKKDSIWVLSKDKVMIDFAPFKRGTGFYGTRDVSYRNFLFDIKRDDARYEGTDKVISAEDAYKKSEDFWSSARHDTLTVQEQGIYDMIDTLKKAPAFRNLMSTLSLVFTGYKAVGPVDIGPIATFNSFNPVEGYRLKVSGETNLKFHPKITTAGYLAYGFKDQEWKYGGSLLYSFRDDFKVNPKHYARVSYQHDVNLVGQILQFARADNLFYSFQRGTNDRMLLLDKFKGEYFLELGNNLSWELAYTNTMQRPVGRLILNYTDPVTQELRSLNELRTSEAELTMRFAPNEQYLQGRSYRMPFYNKFPVFTLKFAAGFNGLLGGEVGYQSLKFNVFKRFYMSFLGSMRFEAEAGKLWGKGVPYFLLHMPKANQTYAFFVTSFNMMNYQEFVSDQYVQLMVQHSFNGFIFNKIPLLRKLKLREVVSFKLIYGGLSDNNNPEKNKELIQFIRDENENRITYTLEDKPYMEASAEIGNIFKVLQVGLVRRLTYLDNPEVPEFLGVKGLGIRFRAKFEF